MIKCVFRVTGKVQNVSLRKYTKLKADQLGLSGWCRNTVDGLSVEGELIGPEPRVKTMVEWMRMEGSPKSRPESVEIIEWVSVSELPKTAFHIKH